MTPEMQAGITALVTAYARAYHATHDSPKIFDDFLADQLYSPEEHDQFDRNLAQTAATLDGLAPDLTAATLDQAAALGNLCYLDKSPEQPLIGWKSAFCRTSVRLGPNTGGG